MGVHELVAATPIPFEGLGLLLAQVEGLARFPVRQQIEGLARKRVEGSHLAFGINIASQGIQLREQLSPAPQPRQIHRRAQLEGLQSSMIGNEGTVLRTNPERLLRFGNFLVIPLQADKAGKGRIVPLRQPTDVGSKRRSALTLWIAGKDLDPLVVRLLPGCAPHHRNLIRELRLLRQQLAEPHAWHG